MENLERKGEGWDCKRIVKGWQREDKGMAKGWQKDSARTRINLFFCYPFDFLCHPFSIRLLSVCFPSAILLLSVLDFRLWRQSENCSFYQQDSDSELAKFSFYLEKIYIEKEKMKKPALLRIHKTFFFIYLLIVNTLVLRV